MRAYKHEMVNYMTAEQALKAADKKRMAQVGFNAAVKIMEGWGCTGADMQRILRMPRSTFHKYKSSPDTISMDDDQLERLSYIANIHGSLRIIFDNQENVQGFMSMENKNAYFEGRTPLSIISSGKFSDLYEVFCRVDSLRSGRWG